MMIRKEGTVIASLATVVAVFVAAIPVAVAVAASTSDIAYSDKTSQKRSISFKLSASGVKNLRYRIDDRCPGGKLLFVRAWGFPVIPVKSGRFAEKFVARRPEVGSTTITGRVSGTTVIGSVHDQTTNTVTHKRCAGTATFKLRPGARPPNPVGASH